MTIRVRVSLEFLDSDCFNFAFVLIRSSIYTFDAYEFVIPLPTPHARNATVVTAGQAFLELQSLY